MQRKVLLALVAFAIVLVRVAVVSFSRKPSQPVSVNFVRSDRHGSTVMCSFQIKNYTSKPCNFSPVAMERWNGTNWLNLFEYHRNSLGPSLAGYASMTCTCGVPNLTVNSRLRFRILVSQRLTGLDGYLRRIELRGRTAMVGFSPQGMVFRRISLNPFDKSIEILGPSVEVLSDEFTERSAPSLLELSPSTNSAGLSSSVEKAREAEH